MHRPLVERVAVGHLGDDRPRYITMTRWLMCRTTARSCAMNISERCISCLQVHQQVDDLRLDGHVERADRLVADDQLRLEHQRARDADALALAAGELVRVAVDVLRARPTRPSIASTFGATSRAASPGNASTAARR
jgi:hypothetical protein